MMFFTRSRFFGLPVTMRRVPSNERVAGGSNGTPERMRKLLMAISCGLPSVGAAAPLAPQRLSELEWLGIAPATLRRLAPDDKLLGELEIYGQKNIPTASQLLREFNGLTSPILDTLETKSDGSLSSRLVAGVKKFVKVRPTAPVKGDSPKALVSQILDALEKGELQRASDRWKRLAENAQAVSAQWHEKLLARITVNDLISKTVQSYLNATTLQ